jgi:diaminopimelate decarboxylase
MASTLRFLTSDSAGAIRAEHGTPVFIYDEKTLQANADAALAFPNAFGVTAR